MRMNRFRDTLLYLYLTREYPVPPRVRHIVFGNILHDGRYGIPLGGEISLLHASSTGIDLAEVFVPFQCACGHIAIDIKDFGGRCTVCRGILCSKPGCLRFCDLMNIAVCRRCSKTIDNVVTVSRRAQKKFPWSWKRKAKKIAIEKRKYLAEIKERNNLLKGG